MNMKNKLFLATTIIALAACSDNTYLGDENGVNGSGGAITFGFDVPNATRAEGSAAATALGNQFIVWGEKNETGNGTEATAANLVFKNYKVEYTDNTAYTTTSNTKNWEYVGLTPYTQVTPALTSGTKQTIKYWDFSADKYTFTAVSALSTDITDGNVVIAKNTTGTSSSDFNKGYDIEVKTGASLDKIFVADRNVITSEGKGTDREAVNKYGGNVTMTFRNFMSKIRFGIYETVPGYKVKITKVYYTDGADNYSTTNFGVDGKFLTVGDGSSKNTIFTVTYDNSADNKALVALKSGTTPGTQDYFETAPAAEVTSGTPKPQIIVPILTADYIGTTPTTATFDKKEKVTTPSASEKDGVYTTVLPFPTNNTPIKLKIDYKLISEDTGETIEITEKTAEVPAKYCQWKSNYAYTYLFKISDKTGDLYPITFDAVEITDENGLAEYITTVSEPSITTFGVDATTGKYTTGKNDYGQGSDIYATFMKGDAVQTPSLATADANKANYVQIYYVVSSDATNFPITEASVAERLATTPSGTAKLTCTNITTSTSTDYFAGGTAPTVVDEVPAEDGTTKTIKAVKLDKVKGQTGAYAIEFITYEKVAPKLTSEQSKVGYYSLSGETFTKETTGNGDGSTEYYKQIKTYKVITVVAAP